MQFVALPLVPLRYGWETSAWKDTSNVIAPWETQVGACKYGGTPKTGQMHPVTLRNATKSNQIQIHLFRRPCMQ